MDKGTSDPNMSTANQSTVNHKNELNEGVIKERQKQELNHIGTVPNENNQTLETPVESSAQKERCIKYGKTICITSNYKGKYRMRKVSSYELSGIIMDVKNSSWKEFIISLAKNIFLNISSDKEKEEFMALPKKVIGKKGLCFFSYCNESSLFDDGIEDSGIRVSAKSSANQTAELAMALAEHFGYELKLNLELE